MGIQPASPPAPLAARGRSARGGGRGPGPGAATRSALLQRPRPLARSRALRVVPPAPPGGRPRAPPLTSSSFQPPPPPPRAPSRRAALRPNRGAAPRRPQPIGAAGRWRSTPFRAPPGARNRRRGDWGLSGCGWPTACGPASRLEWGFSASSPRPPPATAYPSFSSRARRPATPLQERRWTTRGAGRPQDKAGRRAGRRRVSAGGSWGQSRGEGAGREEEGHRPPKKVT